MLITCADKEENGSCLEAQAQAQRAEHEHACQHTPAGRVYSVRSERTIEA